MSFATHRKRALDERRPMHKRRSSVRSCIEHCRWYTGPNGFNRLTGWYERTWGLDQDDLTSETIQAILMEITSLREASKQIMQEYAGYRRMLKAKGRRLVSKSDRSHLKQCQDRISLLWDFDRLRWKARHNLFTESGNRRFIRTNRDVE